ncbi:Transcription factor bHLH47 [Spatholobus suberectus]|nr:Transcription factor bHLH47 [Spatholobus suberectus]
MGSETLAPVVEKINTSQETSRKRSCPCKKNQGKVPTRVRKAEREKIKREHLNELFLGLANALGVTDLSEQSNGKASILREATKLLKDLLSQIETLKKDSASLLSETHYVTMEKNEVVEENSSLKTQIEKLQGEIKTRVAQSKPDLNVPPHLELQQLEKTTKFPKDSHQLSSIKPTLQQGQAVLVVPLSHHHQDALSTHKVAELTPKPTSTISKPHARYPTPMDLWPLQLLAGQPTSS